MSDLKTRAEAHFKKMGIDPSKEQKNPQMVQVPTADRKEFAAASTTTHPCTISTISVLFYTYCEVSVPAIGYTFKGHSGGLGVGGIDAKGVIYYADQSVLLATKDFGVFFGAEDGGVIHVTWGSHGNATAIGVGEGGGAFGGSGSWKKS